MHGIVDSLQHCFVFQLNVGSMLDQHAEQVDVPLTGSNHQCSAIMCMGDMEIHDRINSCMQYAAIVHCVCLYIALLHAMTVRLTALVHLEHQRRGLR